MHYPKRMCLLLSFGVILSSLTLFAGTASAETGAAVSSVPIATGVSVATETTEEIIPVATGSTALTGNWVDTTDGRKYSYADGTYAVNTQVIDGVAYRFEEDGTQCTGWQSLNGTWYYYDPQTYQAAVGEQEIDGVFYLFDYTGAEKTGWRTVNGIRQYYDAETGKPCTGWILHDGNRYYVDETSGKQTGECTIDGVRYQLNREYGWQQMGFCTFSDKTVSYYNDDGAPAKGWMTLETTGKRYYFDNSYIMQTGWQSLDQHRYYFSSDGAMQTDWQTISGGRYYFGDNGVMLTGWQTIKGSQYYFNANGVTQMGFQTISGNQYYFSTTGAMQTGWQTINGSTYYFKANGVMLTGQQTINGKKYLFLSNGTLRQIKICLDAGHYGKYNQSPVNGTYYESDMSWKIHLYLKAALESYGIEVITTRATQAGDLGLEARGKMAAGCDLFLSLHSNACGNASIDAPLACCTVTGEMDSLGQKLANTVHTVMGTSGAGTIWKRVGENGNYYGVLRGAASVGVPGILLEHSYHTNLRATNWLLVDANLQKMAAAEAAVIAQYFGLT